MNVANFASLFHQGSLFQQNRPLNQTPGQAPVNGVLNRLSGHLLTAQGQGKDLKARFDTVELSAGAADSKGDLAMEGAPEELLRCCLHLCRLGASISQGQEKSLMEYRDQLTAFDQAIQDYQDMLDGKAALPEQMGREEAALLLDNTKAAREQFLKQGAEELNRFSKECPTPEGLFRNTYSMITGETGGTQDDSRWQIDPSAGDIYAEIDRALASAHKVTSTFQKGASNILAELKRRGCLKEGEASSLGVQGPADSGAAARASMFQDIYEDLWSTFRQGMGGARGQG